jgi:hypothetical protein
MRIQSSNRFDSNVCKNGVMMVVLRLNFSFETRRFLSGLPDISWYNIPKWEEYTRMATKYTKWPQNIPNGSEIG